MPKMFLTRILLMTFLILKIKFNHIQVNRVNRVDDLLQTHF